MIKLNPPLTTLNLETNNLDASCARLIGEALESNDNLQVLNISGNKLSDLGISYLLQSLIRSRLTTLKLEEAEKKLREPEIKDNFPPTSP
jgi:Ran GTPase-activating protein (RanGAP) involved in mRNA processing and transport